MMASAHAGTAHSRRRRRDGVALYKRSRVATPDTRPPMSETAAIEHQSGLTSGDFTQVDEPLPLFATWFAEAQASEPADPNAMALATVDADGLPDVRMVLMKGYDAEGFVFYSHIASQKGRELATNPKAALLFHWKSLRRQVRIRGTVAPVTDSEADDYFATRPKQAQIGAWASKQSQ